MGLKKLKELAQELIENPMTMKELQKYYRYKSYSSEENAMRKIIKQRRKKESKELLHFIKKFFPNIHLTPGQIDFLKHFQVTDKRKNRKK